MKECLAYSSIQQIPLLLIVGSWSSAISWSSANPPFLENETETWRNEEGYSSHIALWWQNLTRAQNSCLSGP